MTELFPDLFQVIAARAATFVVGWREGMSIHNDEFLYRVAAWRNLLRHTDGKNFALFYTDSIEFAAALLGAWYAGKTVWLSADTLALSCLALQDSVDGFLGEFPAELFPIAPETDQVPSADDFVASFSPLDPTFVGLVVHTSGTTGNAEAIPKKVSQLTSEVATLETLFGEKIGDASIVATVSHQHIYGLLFKVLWPLMAGRAIHARSLNFPEELAQTLATNSCALVASPAHLKRLPEHLKWSDAVSLRAVFSSGGPLDIEVAHEVERLLGQTPIEVYGSSETGGVAWRQRVAGSDDTWLPLPCVDWRIEPENNLLEVRSPHLANDAWLRLADRALASVNDRFLLLGRSDRIVKIEEKRISLTAIETLLLASEFVTELSVVVCDAGPDQRQRLAAIIVLSELGKRFLIANGKIALNLHLRSSLVGSVEPVALPRRWRYVEQMPINAQGKTTRSQLLALLEQAPRSPHLCLLERSAVRVVLQVGLPTDLFYFEGHFDVASILPGVVQVDWAIKNARQYFDMLPQFRAIHALKFERIIRAETQLSLELMYDSAKGSLSFRYYSPAGQHSSGRIIFVHDRT
ncbi:MAG: AMP-binding protein [Pseudomonadota bacterium]